MAANIVDLPSAYIDSPVSSYLSGDSVFLQNTNLNIYITRSTDYNYAEPNGFDLEKPQQVLYTDALPFRNIC